MGIAYPEEVFRFSEDIIELIEKYNVSAACFLPPPRSINLILQLSWLDIGIFAALTAMTALSLIIYVENTCYLLKKVSCLIKVKTLVWISAAPIVIGITSCIGLWVPRAIMFINMMAATYFGFCFYLLLLVIVEMYGGEEAMLEQLDSVTIAVSTGPCCCCCPCLPRMRMTRKKFRIFVLGSFQVAFLRPVIYFLGIVLWTNGLYDPDDLSSTSIFLWLDLFLGVSTILGLWPTNILFREAKQYMTDQNLKAKFALFQAILILSSLQNSIIGTLAGAGHISCSPPYSAKTRGQHEEGHHFDWDNTSVLGHAKQRHAREFLEAWHSNWNSINKHIDLEPIYHPLRKRTGNDITNPRKPNQINRKQDITPALRRRLTDDVT